MHSHSLGRYIVVVPYGTVFPYRTMLLHAMVHATILFSFKFHFESELNQRCRMVTQLCIWGHRPEQHGYVVIYIWCIKVNNYPIYSLIGMYQLANQQISHIHRICHKCLVPWPLQMERWPRRLSPFTYMGVLKTANQVHSHLSIHSGCSTKQKIGKGWWEDPCSGDKGGTRIYQTCMAYLVQMGIPNLQNKYNHRCVLA